MVDEDDNNKMENEDDEEKEDEQPLPLNITKDDNGKYQWTCEICQKISDTKFKMPEEAIRSLNGHKLSAHGVSERAKPRTPEQEIERAIRDALYVVDIPSQKHSGIVRLIMSGDYQNPDFIRNILMTMKLPEDKARTVAKIVDVAIKKINETSSPSFLSNYTQTGFTNPNEMMKSLIQMLNERSQIQQMELLIRQMMEGVSERRPRRLEDGTTVWMSDKEYTDYIIQMERIKAKKQQDDGANKRKIRVLDDGSQVPMTDEEYAQYKIAMATRTQTKSSDETIELQKRIAELEKEREKLLVEGLKKELTEKLDDIERRVGVSDFERFKYFKQKARELGFVVSGDKTGETEVKLKEMENKVQLLTKTMDNMARKTDTLIQITSPIVRALSSKILLDSGAKPPQLRKYTDEQMNGVSDELDRQ